MIGLNSPMNPAVTRAAVRVYMVQPLRGVKRAARPPLMPTMMAKARSSMDRDVEYLCNHLLLSIMKTY